MSQPRISVIIPNWNRASLLPATLECFLNQSLQPAEIIVVDDGSTDHYPDVVAAYQGRVKFMTHSGKGPGAARNAGFNASTGDYIKFFDSDDVLTANSLEVQYKALVAGGQGLVYSPYVHTHQQSDGSWTQVDPILQYHPVPRGKTIRQYMTRGFFTVIPGFLFARSFWDKVAPWREDMVAYEDWDLLWRIGKLAPNPPHTNECCVFYRYHGAQTTGSNQSNLQRDRQRIQCFYEAEVSIRKAEFGKGITTWDRNLLRGQILKTLSIVKEEPEYAHMFKAYNTPMIRLAQRYLQVENKLGRVQTKTDWQPYHGANADAVVFAEFHSKLPAAATMPPKV